VDHHVGVGNQLVDRVAIQHVAPLIPGLRPPVGCRLEGASRHPNDSAHHGFSFERGDGRNSDFAGRAGHGHRQCHPTMVARILTGETTFSRAVSRVNIETEDGER
jgi:predicted thioesterase